MNGYYDVPKSKFNNPENQLTVLAKNIPGGLYQCYNDPNFTLVYISDSFLSIFGYNREEIKEQFHNRFINMIYPGDKADVLRATYSQLAVNRSIELEFRIICKNGKAIWVLQRGTLLEDHTGQEYFYCVLMDITDRKRAREELRLSLERHKVIMDQATDIIFEWDIEADTLDFSPNWKKKFGYTPIQNNVSRRIPRSSNIDSDGIPALTKVMQEIASGVPYTETELRICNISGVYIWCRIRITTQFDSDKHAIKGIGIITDITAEKQARQELLDLAHHDSLTGLFNKTAMKALTEREIGKGISGRTQALLIIDIDDFKSVNDTFGHLCGDALLTSVADVLKKSFRSTDIIGRIGGDEFLVYMPEVTNEEAVKSKALTVLNRLSEICPQKNSAPISCSIGAAVFPHKSIDYFALYHCADRALYQKKNSGKGGFTLYHPDSCNDALPCGIARSAIGESIDSEEINLVEEKLAQYVFRMLYHSIDIETAVNQLLKIIGQSYDVSRVYIFENNGDGQSCSNTFEWCAPGVSPEIENLQNMLYIENLDDYLKNFTEGGVFYCRDIKSLNPNLYAYLNSKKVCSLLQCAIMDEGEYKGYVGFDECREHRYWTKQQIRSLALVANVLSVFLMKLRFKEQLKQLTGPENGSAHALATE